MAESPCRGTGSSAAELRITSVRQGPTAWVKARMPCGPQMVPKEVLLKGALRRLQDLAQTVKAAYSVRRYCGSIRAAQPGGGHGLELVIDGWHYAIPSMRTSRMAGDVGRSYF